MNDGRTEPDVIESVDRSMSEDEHLLAEAERIAVAVGKTFPGLCEVVLHDLRHPEHAIRVIGDKSTRCCNARRRHGAQRSPDIRRTGQSRAEKRPIDMERNEAPISEGPDGAHEKRPIDMERNEAPISEGPDSSAHEKRPIDMERNEAPISEGPDRHAIAWSARSPDIRRTGRAQRSDQ